MPEFQLTHVALVGARMAMFHPYGIHARNELAMRALAPVAEDIVLRVLPEQELRAMLRQQLPLWVHNILVDPAFPARDRLRMPLRRFEGELHDSRENEVFAMVLSAGFRDQNLDPLNLPDSMPLRQKCSMVMQIGEWQDAYRRLEHDLVEILSSCAPALDLWLDSVREPSQALVN